MAIYYKGERLDGGSQNEAMTPYQYAVAGGYEGTEEEFLDLFKNGPYLPTAGGTVMGKIVGGQDFLIASEYIMTGTISPSSITVTEVKPNNQTLDIMRQAISFGLNNEKRLNFQRLSDGTIKIFSTEYRVVGDGIILGNIATPELATDATNKTYVDTAIGASKTLTQTGHYIGNGESGEGYKITLDIGFQPKFFVVQDMDSNFMNKNGVGTPYFIWFEGNDKVVGGDGGWIYVTVTDTSISFYADVPDDNDNGVGAIQQFNYKGTEYIWFALG